MIDVKGEHSTPRGTASAAGEAMANTDLAPIAGNPALEFKHVDIARRQARNPVRNSIAEGFASMWVGFGRTVIPDLETIPSYLTSSMYR